MAPRRLRIVLALAAAGLLVLGRRLLRTAATTAHGRARIIDPGRDRGVSASGAVASVQAAEIEVDRSLLERIWTPDSLELLARGYWAFLRRFTLGIVRVVYGDRDRTVTAFGRIPLLRFGAPRYEAGAGRGRVTWPIASGPLVAREGRGKGHLRVAVERREDGGDRDDRVRLIARVEVENFYPGLRGRGAFARFGAWFYAQTQLRIHVIVCNAYLLSLPTLDFPGVETTALPSELGRDRSFEPSAA